jgi:hypothetical protein
MKHILFAFLLFPILLFAQYPNSGNKARLGWQTTGSGLVFVGAGNPSFVPTNIKNAYAYVDSLKNTMYIYQDSLWQQVSPYPSATPPLLRESIGISYFSAGGGSVWGDGVSEIWYFGSAPFIYRQGAVWHNTIDSIYYVYNISVDAWQPLDPIYNSDSEPSEIAATSSTAAVTYRHNLHRNKSTDTLYRYSYLQSDWVPIEDLTQVSNGLRVYTSVSAAQSDSTFVVGGIYRLTGDSILRIKTL